MAVELDARSLVADGVAQVCLLAEPAGAPSGIILSLHGSASTPAAQSRRARMACHFAWTHSDQVAAVGAVAGLRAGDEPAPTRAVPVLAFHGTADRINPYSGGTGERWRESVLAAAHRWAIANGHPAEPVEGRAGTSLTRTTFGTDGGSGEVTLWTIDGGGHTWPGGRSGLLMRLFLGRTTSEIDATDEIWRFFMRHA